MKVCDGDDRSSTTLTMKTRFFQSFGVGRMRDRKWVNRDLQDIRYAADSIDESLTEIIGRWHAEGREVAGGDLVRMPE